MLYYKSDGGSETIVSITVSVATTLPTQGFRARAMTNGGGYGDLPTDTSFFKMWGVQTRVDGG